MIQAVNIAKYYGAHAAVEALNLHVPEGAVVGLLGLNGAGKTTTLNILSGLVVPSCGNVTVGGINMAQDPEGARAQVGFLPETPPLYQDMRVRAYLRFVARIRHVGIWVEANIDAALAATDLLAVADARIATLSHGYHRRLGIAQTLVAKPAVIMLDEPTSGLDPMQVVHMRKLIRSLRGRATIVISSHVLTEIAALCDRIVVLHEGRVIAEGSEEELSLGGLGHKRLLVEVRGDAGVLRRTLEALPATTSYHVEHLGQDVHRALVTLQNDCRAEVSRALCTAELSLLTLTWQPEGLEQTFLRLMGQQHAHQQALGARQ